MKTARNHKNVRYKNIFEKNCIEAACSRKNIRYKNDIEKNKHKHKHTSEVIPCKIKVLVVEKSLHFMSKPKILLML